jgi:prevent-host-death family protein
MHVNATELKNKLGKYLRICMRQDVIITKHGKDIAILKGIDDKSFVKEESEAYDYSDPNHSLGKMTYSEFKDFTSKTDERYELIDGHVYILASPKVNHQHTSAKIYVQFYNWFEGKKCIPYYAPFDITLNLQKENPDVIQPDLIVICDLEEYLDDTGYYMGIPTLVVEILSESTRRKDILTKLNLYMSSGICEYWIADPINREISVYLFEDKTIKDKKTYLSGMVCESFVFKGLKVKLDGLFM